MTSATLNGDEVKRTGAAAETDVSPRVEMTLAEGSDLVLAAARVLYVNGQTTDQTVAGAQQLAGALGLRTTIVPRWGELQLQSEDGDAKLTSVAAAAPTGVHMTRVAAMDRTIEDLDAGRLAPARAMEAIRQISQAPPLPTWLFALAAGAGAVALAVIFGLRHLDSAALIFASGSAGGVLRRQLAKYSTNVYLQPFAAALLAGVIGGLAVRWGLSSPLRLIAITPCLVLVPGPHLLNGALDFFQARIHLGAARLLYGGLVLVAIATGLMLGLALVGASLDVDPLGRSVPLWRDVIAAGLAAACYGIYFSMPLRMLAWPVAVGLLAHSLRWTALSDFHSSAATAALVACLFVGLVITPAARRSHLPFAAIGFASVVSIVPGIYVMRMAGGLVHLADGSHTTLELVSGTITDGATVILVLLAMAAGLIVPKLIIDGLRKRPRPRPAATAAVRASLYG